MNNALERIGEQLENAEQALWSARGARSSKTHWRAKLRIRSRRFIVPTIALMMFILAGAAVAASLGTGVLNPQDWVKGARVAPLSSVTPSQSAELAILARARTALDNVPAVVAMYVTQDSQSGAIGANLSLARRAQGLSSGAAWVIPGNSGWICFDAVSSLAANGEPVDGADGGLGAATCQPPTALTNGGVSFTTANGAHPDNTLVAGVVPNGVSTVIVDLPGGDSLTLAVHENVYLAIIDGAPTSISFDGPAGRVTHSE
jgi:hypothetical protein